MDSTKSTIDFIKKRIKRFETAILILESLKDLPFTFSMSLSDGLWCDLKSTGELRELRRTLGNKCVAKCPDSNFRRDGDGAFIFHYEVALNPMPDSERNRLAGMFYANMLKEKFGPSIELLVCVAPSDSCVKVKVGTQDVYEWKCSDNTSQNQDD